MEVLLVLAILVIMAGIAYPSLEAMYSGYRLRAAADRVRSSWATARARALEEGRAYRFAVLPGYGNFRVAPDSADFWAGVGMAGTVTDATTPPFILEDTLPEGIRFAGTDSTADLGSMADAEPNLPVGSVDPSQWVRWIVFLPDGTARTYWAAGGIIDDNIEVVLQGRGTRPIILQLRGLTGIVTVRQMNQP
jgi:hypothetical protein